MTTDERLQDVQQRDTAEELGRLWNEALHDLMENYRYDDMRLLLYVSEDYEEIEVFNRKKLLLPVEAASGMLAAPQRRAVTTELPEGYLLMGIDFYVINANDWDGLAPELIERDARMAESFGLHEIAANARSRVR